MSVVDPCPDSRRTSELTLRLGLDPAFGPPPEIERGEEVLYAGRLSREKGVRELLEAAAGAPEPWPLALIAHSTPSAALLGGFVEQLLRPRRYRAADGIPSVAMRELGYVAEANRVVDSLVRAVDRDGYREYYNPLTGRG